MWLPQRDCEVEVQQEVAPQSFTVEFEGSSARRNLIRLPNSESPEPNKQNESNSNEPTESSANRETQQSKLNESSTLPEVRRSSPTSRPPERLDPSWSN